MLALSHFTPAASFLFWPLPPTHCRCRGLLWQLKYSVTHTQKASSGRRIETDLYLTIHSTQNRLTSMPSAGYGIRTLHPRKQAAAEPHLRPRGQRHRSVCTFEACVYTNFDRPFMVSNNICIYGYTACLQRVSCTARLSSLLACSSSSVDPISSSPST